MEMLSGKPLYEGWYDDVSPAKVQQFRTRSLQGIAEAMSQLSKFTFDQGGSLLFDGDNHISGTGPRRVLDHNEAYEHLCTRDPIPHSLFSDVKPFKDVKASFLSILDQREGRRIKSTMYNGADHMLRLFIDWSHENENDGQQQPLVLAHPDFGMQNILVAEDDTLTGIIGWDWVAAVPRSVGNQKLPDFIIRDYDPEDYNWDDHYETSSEELAWYRTMYAQYMEACSRKNESERLMSDPEQKAKSSQAVIEAANLTRRSLLMGSLEKAANEQIPSLSIIIHLFEELEKLDCGKNGNRTTWAVILTLLVVARIAVTRMIRMMLAIMMMKMKMRKTTRAASCVSCWAKLMSLQECNQKMMTSCLFEAWMMTPKSPLWMIFQLLL